MTLSVGFFAGVPGLPVYAQPSIFYQGNTDSDDSTSENPKISLTPAWDSSAQSGKEYRTSSIVPPEGKKGLIQNITFGGSWIPKNGTHGLGFSEFDASVTLGFPSPQFKTQILPGPSFITITPSFKYTNISWKENHNFPDSLYRAGLGIGWMKFMNERWKLMARMMPAYASDGNETKQAFVCPLMAGAIWSPNSRWTLSFGAMYLDRTDIIPVLPFGGLIYTPNEDWRFELMAPTAKVVRRLSTFCDEKYQNWVYIGGGFDGGTWAIRSVGDQADFAMYREYSVVLGWEYKRTSFLKLNTEIAYLFGREMKFDHNTQPNFKPDDSLALRLQISY